MSNSEKTIRIRNVNTGTETTMLVDRFKVRIERMTRQGWVIVDPEHLGIEVVAPPKTIKEKVDAAKKEMGVEPSPPEADNQPDEVIESRSFEDFNVKQLKAFADESGVEYPRNASKTKMIEILSK